MSWPGTKRAAGVCERLINMIPPHDIYIAPFAGHCAVASRIRPAGRRVFVDLDPAALSFWQRRDPGAELFQCDAAGWLRGFFQLDRFGGIPEPPPGCFLHVDPPYFPGTCGAGIYQHELTAADHVRLLRALLGIRSPVMLAGYRCEIYDAMLADWRRVDYPVQTRGGIKTESVWLNYPEPAALHDWRFIGDDKRQRERIRRRQRNAVAMLDGLPADERAAMLAAIAEYSAAESGDAAGGSRADSA